MRALGIDFGLKRVGLALSDPDGRMALPHAVLERSTRDKIFADIVSVIESRGVQAVVVGLPLALDGEETLTTRQARNFAQSLARRTAVPVHLMDERLSSAEAEARLKEAGLCPKKRKSRLDSQAACLILQAWLDAQGF